MDRIKESIDSLPIAACFFDKKGVLRLINRRMLAISDQLRKTGIQTLSELQAALQFPPKDILCLDPQLRIFRFPDGKALRFGQEIITTKKGTPYTQVTAADVTELIHRQSLLKEENIKLTEANAKLRALFEQMPEVIRQEETLAMKLKVHDGIGHSILAARRALLRNAGIEELHASAEIWEQSIAVLYRYNQMSLHNEILEEAQKRSEEMGVRLISEGPQPKMQLSRRLAALAICECAANCVRHADGTELYVLYKQYPDHTEMSVSNNGAVPVAKIKEGGGLSMLRHKVEGSGGSMNVQSFPNFKLILCLPEQEETTDESNDS